MKRQKTREVKIGSVVIGGDRPVAIQSMLCAPLWDIEANVRQTRALYEAGCQINRVAMPAQGGTQLIQAIKEAEAKAAKLVSDASEEGRGLIEQAKREAEAIREEAARKRKEEAGSLEKKLSEEGEAYLAESVRAVSEDIAALKRSAGEKADEVVAKIVEELI